MGKVAAASRAAGGEGGHGRHPGKHIIILGRERSTHSLTRCRMPTRRKLISTVVVRVVDAVEQFSFAMEDTHGQTDRQRDRPTDLHPHPPSTYRTIRSSRPVCKLRTHSTAPCVWLVLLLVWVGNCNTSLNIDFYSSVVGKNRSSISTNHIGNANLLQFSGHQNTPIYVREVKVGCGAWNMEGPSHEQLITLMGWRRRRRTQRRRRRSGEK